MFSIPYDTGWSLTVDGEEVTLSAFKDALLSAELTTGTHTIHLEYHTQGLALGTAISVGAIVVLILLFFITTNYKKKKKKTPTSLDDEEEIVL
jgi:uncharacterized membrane protein YfhO